MVKRNIHHFEDVFPIGEGGFAWPCWFTYCVFSDSLDVGMVMLKSEMLGEPLCLHGCPTIFRLYRVSFLNVQTQPDKLHQGALSSE